MRITTFPIVIISFWLILFNGCKDFPDELIMPAWDVDLNVPLTTKTYTIYDMFKPESQNSINVALGENNFYLIYTDEFISKSDVADYLDFSDQPPAHESVILPTNLAEAETYLLFPSELEVENAIFKTGIISFTIRNFSNSQISSTLLIPGIKKPDGSELRFEHTINALGVDSIIYDLTNHLYNALLDNTSENKKGIKLIAYATSSVSGIYEQVDCYLFNIAFNSATGLINRKYLEHKRFTSSLKWNDAKDIRGNLFIKEATLELKFHYISNHQNPFEIEFNNAQIIGVLNDGTTKNLFQNGSKYFSFTLINGECFRSFNENNSNITEFLAFLPDSIIVTSDLILNPHNSLVARTVTNLDSVSFGAKFHTKSIFALKQTNFIDTLEVEFSQDERNKIKNSSEAEINIHIENSIPFNAFVKATVMDKYYNPLFVITKNSANVDSLYFAGSQVNNFTGQVLSPSVTTNSVKLISSQLKQLSEARYIVLSSTVSTSGSGSQNPTMVQFKSSDWLKLKCYGKVKFRVNSE